jgi:hypothetical protein
MNLWTRRMVVLNSFNRKRDRAVDFRLNACRVGSSLHCGGHFPGQAERANASHLWRLLTSGNQRAESRARGESIVALYALARLRLNRKSKIVNRGLLICGIPK